MTIQLTTACFVSGSLAAAGSQHTLDEATEAHFIYQGLATRVGAAPSQSGTINNAVISTDSSGNTVLLGPDGEAVSLGGFGTDSSSVSTVAEFIQAIADLQASRFQTRSTETSTVTATTGSATLVGSGTGWTTVGEVSVGDLWKPTGGTRYYKVKSVNSDTSITLHEPILVADNGAHASSAFFYLKRHQIIMNPGAYTVIGASPIILQPGFDITTLDGYATFINEGQANPNSPFSNLSDNNFTNVRWDSTPSFGSMDGMFGSSGFPAISASAWAGIEASFNRCIVDTANKSGVHSGGQTRMPIIAGSRVSYNQCEFLQDAAATFAPGGGLVATNANTRVVMNNCKHIKVPGRSSAAGNAIHQYLLEIGENAVQTLKGTFDIINPVMRFQDLAIDAGFGYTLDVGGLLVNSAAIVNLNGGSITVENTSGAGDVSVGATVTVAGATLNIQGSDIDVSGTGAVGVKVGAVASTVNIRAGARIKGTTNSINAGAGSTVNVSGNADLIGATTGAGTINLTTAT